MVRDNNLTNNLKSHNLLLISLDNASVDTNEFVYHINRITHSNTLTMVEALATSKKAVEAYVDDLNAIYRIAYKTNSISGEILKSKTDLEKEYELYYKTLNNITNRLTSIGDV